MNGDAAAVLEFWFESPAGDPEMLVRKMKRWYRGGADFDREIETRFGPLIARAVSGELDAWSSDPDGLLALIVMLDQFTRSVYRDTPKMYAGDARAQRLALEALDRGIGHDWNTERRNFLLMPLVHAEDLALQERAVVEVAAVVAKAPAQLHEIFSMGIEQSRKYRDVIARFGRFPHRNAILGRESTPEEIEFLRDWAEKQPPSAARGMGA